MAKSSTNLFNQTGIESDALGGVGSFVRITGDTMTGLLELSGNAVNPLNPVTLQQFNLGLLGLVPKGSVEAASDANINLAAPASALVDGHSLNPNDRVLIQAQTLPIENGIYVFNGVGVPMTRDPLMATGSDAFGAYVSVVNGLTYASTFRICISDPAIVDTDDLVWDFQAASLVSADGTTITDSGGIFSVANGGILDIHVNAAAAIQWSKMAALTADSWVYSDASGELVDVTLGADFAVITDSNGLPAVSAVTATELSYVSGVTSSIQTQINNLASSIPVFPVDLTTDVTGILPIANGGTNSSSFTTGSVIFADGTKLTENNNEFFWDNTNFRLGINAGSSPTSALQIGTADATKYLQMDPAAGLIVSGSGSNVTRIVAESTFGSSIPAEIAASSRPSGAMGGFEDLGWFSFFGRDNAGNQRRGAYIRGITSGAWTSTSLPTHMDFFTVPSGSASEVQRMRLFSSGELYVGATGLVGSTGTLNIGPLTASKIGLYVRGQSGQTADLLQLQNNSSVTLMNVEADGDLNARSLRATGTIGAGFLELADQSVGLTAPSSGIKVFSTGGNFAVKTSSPTYILDHSLLSTNRTFQFQDADYLIANVPAVIGPVKSSGSDLTVGQIDLVTDVTGTLDVGNGGTGVTSIGAGIVTSSGSALSSVAYPSANNVLVSTGSGLTSYHRAVVVKSGNSTVTGTTWTNVTGLTLSSLVVGTYKVEAHVVFSSSANSVGTGFRFANGTATIGSIRGKWFITQATNGTAQNYQFNQTNVLDNVSSTAVPAGGFSFSAFFTGMVVISSPGTIVVQNRAETAAGTITTQDSYALAEFLA